MGITRRNRRVSAIALSGVLPPGTGLPGTEAAKPCARDPPAGTT